MRWGGKSVARAGVLSIATAVAITYLLPHLGAYRHQLREQARVADLAAGILAVDTAAYGKAIPLLRPSAERGDKRAIVKLAEAIAFDDRQDASEEALWFPKAAAISPTAVFLIASRLEVSTWGLDNTIDLYAAASRYGSQEATSRLGLVYQEAQFALKSGDEEKGLQLASLLGRTGAFWSQSHDLFVSHLYTIGGERGDFFEALGSVHERARGGDVYAALDLGRTFSVSPLIEGAVRDHELAVGWLQLAAAGDDASNREAAAAMYWLGVEHARCEADCQDNERALVWFKLAEFTCNKIATDDLFPPCDGAKGASLMLETQLGSAALARVDALTRQWAKGERAAILAPIPAGKLYPEQLPAVSRDAIAAAGALGDQFVWLGTFEGLDEAQLHIWIAGHVAEAPTAGHSVMECAGHPVSYAAIMGPAPSPELRQVCKAAKGASCIRLSRAQVVEKCTPPSS